MRCNFAPTISRLHGLSSCQKMLTNINLMKQKSFRSCGRLRRRADRVSTPCICISCGGATGAAYGRPLVRFMPGTCGCAASLPSPPLADAKHKHLLASSGEGQGQGPQDYGKMSGRWLTNAAGMAGRGAGVEGMACATAAQHSSGSAAHSRPHPGLYRPNNTRNVADISHTGAQLSRAILEFILSVSDRRATWLPHGGSCQSSLPESADRPTLAQRSLPEARRTALA